MAKKRSLSDPEYDSYDRIHDYEHPLDVEQGKVRREKAASARLRRKGNQQVKHRLRQIAHPDDIENWDDDPLLDEIEQQAERELGNARTHKRRLHGLAERDARTSRPDRDRGDSN